MLYDIPFNMISIYLLDKYVYIFIYIYIYIDFIMNFYLCVNVIINIQL